MGAAQAAASLFGAASAPSTAPPAAAEPTPDQKAAAILFAPEEKPAPAVAPGNIAAMRAADPERGFYSTEGMLADGIKAMAETYQGDTLEAAEVARDLGMGNNEIKQWLSIEAELQTNPQAAEELQAQTAQRLSDVYGDGAKQALADARRLVARDPRLAPILNRSGLGNHPAVVEHFVQQAQRERLKGRL